MGEQQCECWGGSGQLELNDLGLGGVVGSRCLQDRFLVPTLAV
jgi:hypothetical protein